MNCPLPVIDWSQRRHCDSAKLAISAKIKPIDNIQNLILKEDATLIHKQKTFGRWNAQTELRGWF